jgi:hypothetical protein
MQSKSFLNLLNQIKENFLPNDIEMNSIYNALNNNYKVILYYSNSNKTDMTPEERNLRLYGLLQSLFVSIDSIYNLTKKITKSKNFITINDNKSMRELKYIRNDVVGHPTDRVILNKVCYVILDPLKIKNDEFTYTIYYDTEPEEKVIDLNEMINAYEQEALNLFSHLIDYTKVHETKYLSDDVLNIYNNYTSKENVLGFLNKLTKDFNQSYGKDNRIEKKLLLIKALLAIDKTPVTRYIIEVQLIRLYSQMLSLEGESDVKVPHAKKPKAIREMIKILDETDGYQALEYLKDTRNPMFKKSLQAFYNYAKKNNYLQALKYIQDIQKFNAMKNNQFVYAYTQIFK